MLMSVLALIFLAQTQASNWPPEPKVELLHPKGFRISIEDLDNITQVVFHININTELPIGRQGTYKGEIRHEKDDRWSYECTDVKLKPKDKLYYWIFIAKGGMGYRLQRTYSVEDFGNPSSTLVPPIIETETKMPSLNCEHIILNMTQDLMRLQQEIQSLKKTNEQIERLMRRYPDAKTLKLSGRIPPDGDPTMTVKFIIHEKLGIDPDVIAAVRNEDTSIDFEVSSVVEKIEILQAAYQELAESAIIIS